MARSVFILPLALTLLVLAPSSLAQIWGLQQGQPFLPSCQSSQPRRLQRGQQGQNDCQIDRLSATEPSIRIEAEAGVTEVWDPQEQQEFHCAGVRVIRREIEPKGLVLPHYTNAPSISYIIRGRGLMGASTPGCADTYESFVPSDESRSRSEDDESRRSERDSDESRRSDRRSEDESRRSEHESEESRRPDHRRSEDDESRRSDRRSEHESRRSDRRSEDDESRRSEDDESRRSDRRRSGDESRRSEDDESRRSDRRSEDDESRRSEDDESRRSDRRRSGDESRRSEDDESRRSDRRSEDDKSRRSEDDESRRSDRRRSGDESRRSDERTDQHQKIRRFEKGHIIVSQAGVSKWLYNDGEDRLTVLTVFDTDNFQNQLDDNLRNGFLAGNPQGREGSQTRRDESSRRHESSRHDESSRHHESSRRHGSSRRHHESSRHDESSESDQFFGQNVFNGFDKDLLAKAFDMERETITKIQGQNDERGAIIRVEGNLEMLVPEWDQEEQRAERRHGGRGHRGHHHNGIEQTICSARYSEDIDNPERADVFNPQGGRLSTVNSQTLPILNQLRLSAEKVSLYENAIMGPTWKINAHSIIYITKGSGRVQVSCQEGNLVFDDRVQEGQLLVVPQNFVVLKQADQEGLEWVALLTNDEAISSPLAGRISAIRGLPVEVVMNVYGLSREEAQRLKYSRQELSVFSPSKRSDRRGEQYSIV